jgi:hypothetical protein
MDIGSPKLRLDYLSDRFSVGAGLPYSSRIIDPFAGYNSLLTYSLAKVAGIQPIASIKAYDIYGNAIDFDSELVEASSRVRQLYLGQSPFVLHNPPYPLPERRKNVFRWIPSRQAAYDGHNLLYITFWQYVRQKLESIRALFINGIRILLGDPGYPIVAFVEEQKQRARTAFREGGKFRHKIKVILRPLALIPRSLHPSDSVAH